MISHLVRCSSIKVLSLDQSKEGHDEMYGMQMTKERLVAIVA